VITVDDDGSADFSNIQAAIDDANNGDVVVVFPGTYTGEGNRDIDFLGKAITVRSTKPSNPNIVATTIIDCNGTEMEPHRGFYFHSQEDSNSVLAGFTITNGCACGSFPQYSGGAIYCEADSFQSNTPTITNCIITGNAANEGGAIGCNSRASPNITNCTITDNLAVDGCGGGILYGNCADCTGIISNCTISGNHAAAHGGGIYRGGGSIINCLISANSAGEDGGGLGSCNQVKNCIVTGNSAARWGGGLSRCYSTVNCLIAGNTSECGGGLSMRYGNVTNSTITCNSVQDCGGGIYAQCGGADFTVSNSILWDNEAHQGEAAYLVTCWAIIAQPPYMLEKTSRMVATYSDIAGGLSAVHIDPNSIVIWGIGNIDADPCFVEIGKWVDANDSNTVVEPNDANAVWVDGDYHLKSEGWRLDTKFTPPRWTYDYVTSRCIDAGNPGSALGGELLTIPGDPGHIWGENLRINMGAYGGTRQASMPPYDRALLADITNDGLVNGSDFAHQASDWLINGTEQPGDFNRNGIVDTNDVGLFVDDWLRTTSWYE
jgi:hypothetical protein